MEDVRNRRIKDLVNSLIFLLNKENFHLHQIKIEEKGFRKSVLQFAASHKKLEHVRQIRVYQSMMAENTRQLRIQHHMLEKFLELNTDLKDTQLYQQAGEVLKETLPSLK